MCETPIYVCQTYVGRVLFVNAQRNENVQYCKKVITAKISTTAITRKDDK